MTKIKLSNGQMFEFNANVAQSYINDNNSRLIDWILFDNGELWAFHPEFIDNTLHMDENYKPTKIASLLENNCTKIFLMSTTWSNTVRLKSNKNLYYFQKNRAYKTMLEDSFVEGDLFLGRAIVSVPLKKGYINNNLLPVYVEKKIKNQNKLIVYNKLGTYFWDGRLQNIDGENIPFNILNKYIVIDGYKIKLDNKHLINDILDILNYKIYKTNNYILFDFDKSVLIYLYNQDKQEYTNPERIWVYKESWNYNGHKIFNQSNLPDKINLPDKNEHETIEFIYTEKKTKIIYSKTSEKKVKIK